MLRLTVNRSVYLGVTQVRVKVMLLSTVSRPVCLRVKHPSGTQDKNFNTVRQLWVCWCGPPPLRREDGSVVYNCCWPSPKQSFSGPSPAGLIIIFNCLRFATAPAWRARSPYLCPPGTEWPSCTPRHWVPILPLPTTRRVTVEVFEPVSTRGGSLV
jgi:hypothetical protein